MIAKLTKQELASQLLYLVAQDLVITDRKTYTEFKQATTQGCLMLIQISCDPDGTVSLGYRNDYGETRWVHAIPLQ